MVNHSLCQKAQNFGAFGPYDFVPILPACGSNNNLKMYGETFDFRCQQQKW